MRFSEWNTELDKQQGKVGRVGLTNITETITASNSVISITIGKDYRIEIDGTQHGARFLRTLYTKNKEEFDSLLASLTKQADEMADAMDILLETVTDEMIPETVLARMKGEQVSGDSVDMLKAKVTKGLTELGNIFRKTGKVFQEFRIELGSVGHMLDLRLQDRGSYKEYRLYWGNNSGFVIGYGNHITTYTGGPDQCLSFLNNYDAIKARLATFCKQIREIK